MDSEGLIYVCDRKNNRIQIFDPEGEFVAQWANVQLPTDLHIGRDGLFYLAERESGDAVENLLTVRDNSGSVLASWTTPRSHQIWPDAHGDIYLVSGRGHRRIQGLGNQVRESAVVAGYWPTVWDDLIMARKSHPGFMPPWFAG